MRKRLTTTGTWLQGPVMSIMTWLCQARCSFVIWNFVHLFVLIDREPPPIFSAEPSPPTHFSFSLPLSLSSINLLAFYLPPLPLNPPTPFFPFNDVLNSVCFLLHRPPQAHI